MGTHCATIIWESSGDFTSGAYSRAHRIEFDGGAIVPGSSSPQLVPVPFSGPAGVDPEEALVASASACHMLWFLSLARSAGLEVASYRDQAEGVMGTDESDRMAITRINLRPSVRFLGNAPSGTELAALHEQAHDRCFIANSLRSHIVVEPVPA